VLNRLNIGWSSKALLLFLGGFTIHYALLAWYLNYAYSPGHDSIIPQSLMIRFGVPLLGGIGVSWFFLRADSAHQKMGQGQKAIRGGLLGIAATCSALLVTFVIMAIVGAAIAAADSLLAFLTLPFSVFFFLLGIVTHGMEAVILSLPLSFLYGAALGLALLPSRKPMPVA
jgi:hypothetical protein